MRSKLFLGCYPTLVSKCILTSTSQEQLCGCQPPFFYLTVKKCQSDPSRRTHQIFAPSTLSTAQSSCSPSKSQHTSSTSEAVPPPALSQNRSFSLPPGHAVCCFMDGGVGLYDMGAKKWDFLRDLVFYASFVKSTAHTCTHMAERTNYMKEHTLPHVPDLVVVFRVT